MSELSTEPAHRTNERAVTSVNSSRAKTRQKRYQKQKDEGYISENTLMVCPLPKTISREELINFLHKFGPVKRQYFTRLSFVIEYFDSNPVNMLLSKSDWLPNEKLHLKRKMYNKDSPMQQPQKSTTCTKKIKNKHRCYVMNKTEENIEDIINYESIKPVIENEETFDRQLTALLNAIQLSDAELTNRYNVICTHLDEIFKSVFPECRSYTFGSTLAGLSFKGCDLDIYMYIGKTGLPPFCYKLDIPGFVLTLSIFKRVRRVMCRMKTVFSNIISIPKAKTPIIKFRYIPTKVSCDISFKNGLGIYKSRFLKYCAERDIRLKPLMMLIKYWAKHIGISGIGKISNYGLISLIIFYLQQESVGLLPPLIELQKNCVPQIMQGWQINFDGNTVLPSVSNDSSIPQLLHNFFSFYSIFDFKSRVLCLLDGKTYSAIDFTEIHKLPDYMDRYKSCVMENNTNKLDVEKPLCIQDPIELNQNTTAITSERALKAFKYCCTFGAEICTATSENNYEMLLKALFDTVPPQITQPKKKKTKLTGSIYAGRFLNAGLPDNFKTRTDIIDKEQYKKDNWYFIIFSLIRDIFQMIFKLQVEVLLFDQETKQQKVKVLSDVHTKSYQKITFHCIGNKRVWNNRRKNKSCLLDVQLSSLEKEAIISDKLLEELKEHDAANNIKLDFMCTLEKEDNPVAVTLALCDQGSQKNIFKQFECFANSWIPKIVQKTLTHMLQYKKTYSQLLHHEHS